MKRAVVLTLVLFCVPIVAHAQSQWPAGKVVFTDTETLQTKFTEGTMRSPIRTVVAALPGSPTYTDQTYIVTDSLTAGTCATGGGFELTHCAWTGAAWQALGGGGGSTGWDRDSGDEVLAPTDTDDALCLGAAAATATSSNCPLWLDPATGSITGNVAGGGITLEPALPADGTNVLTLDPNDANTVAAPTGDRVTLHTEEDGELYKRDAGDADSVRIHTDSNAQVAMFSIASANLSNGGTLTLATLNNPSSEIALATNQITVQPGTWLFEWANLTTFNGTSTTDCFSVTLYNDTTSLDVGTASIVSELNQAGTGIVNGYNSSGRALVTTAVAATLYLYSAACTGGTYPTTQSTLANSSSMLVLRLK